MRSDEELLHAYLDGELNAGEAGALEARLRAEPPLAEALVVLARHEAIITEWACSSRAAQGLEPARAVRPRTLVFPRKIVAGIVAAAAAAAIFFALTGVFTGGPEDVAELEDMFGEVFVVQQSGESVAAQRGTRLSLGQGLRTRGEGSFAVVTFPDASRLEIGADTSIRLMLENANPARSGKSSAAKKVFLEEGNVATDMAEQPARHYVLATPHGEAMLSARSSFAIAPEGTRIEPEKGEVQFTRKGDAKPTAVPPGWYAVTGPAKEPMVARPVPEPRMTVNETTGPLTAAAFAPNSQTLATGCVDGSVKLWDPATGSVRNVLRGHRSRIRAVAYSADGTLLASAGEDRKVVLWDPVNGTEVGVLKGYKGAIESLAFAPNGLHLVSGGSQQSAIPGNNSQQPEIRVWNVVTRQEVFVLAEHQAGVLAVAFSPDGAVLATSGRDKTVRLWETNGFTVRHVLTGHQGPVHSVAFAPDGMTLASGGQDRTIRFWDVGLGTERSVLPGFAPQVRSLAFSPDGRFLVAADLNIRLRNLATGREQLIFKGNKPQQAMPTLVLISPDGKTIAATGADKTLRFWDMMEEEVSGAAGG